MPRLVLPLDIITRDEKFCSFECPAYRNGGVCVARNAKEFLTLNNTRELYPRTEFCMKNAKESTP